MTSETQNLKIKLQSLTSAFSDLENQLSPLFVQSLPETLVQLEPIQQAKLQTALAYVVYDLIVIYLKTKGVDPKTHPVISELERIKQYFDKIQNAESPAKRTTEVDKAAASRFIKHALSEAQLKRDREKALQLSWKKTSAEEAQESTSSSSFEDQELPNVKPRHKVATPKMLERRQHHEALHDQDSEDENTLEIFDQSGQGDERLNLNDLSSAKGGTMNNKGKATDESLDDASSSVPMAYGTAKRRRPVMDPFVASGFVGIGEEEQQISSSCATPVAKKSKLAYCSARHLSTNPDTSLLDKGSRKTKKKRKESNTPST